MLVRLRSFPLYLRAPIAAFVVVGIVGYAAGLVYVSHNTGMRATGIVDHYHGKEDDLKFGKSYAEMLEIVHTHLLGMGVLFFALAVLYACTDAGVFAKTFWPTETLLSLLTTFGSLWLVTLGQRWAMWVLYPSSVLMLFGYLIMSGTIVWNALTPDRSASSPLASTSSPTRTDESNH